MASDPVDNNQRTKSAPSAEHVDAINAMFTQFQLAYHNQFHKAFANDEQIRMAKQLWLNNLCDLSPQRIAAGTRRAIRESEYLPTLHTIRAYCDPSAEELGLPNVHQAYLEACRAPNPKAQQQWSHPIVYLAGRESDWFFLASTSEAKAFPVYRRNYEILMGRLLAGEQLSVPVPKAIPESIAEPLSNEENRKRMQKLRQDLGI